MDRGRQRQLALRVADPDLMSVALMDKPVTGLAPAYGRRHYRSRI
ncbi:MAG TPA: hypothetical protein VGM16_08550 [Gammaproteobacteria bacterium]|jgi:hypothetical protein